MSYLSDLLGTAYKEGMTEDEISAALEAQKQNSNTEIEKLKASLSKANSEAADYKKQLREKLTDAQKAEAERNEAYEKLVKDNEELKRSIKLAEQTSKLVALGYDEKLAADTASAMVDGDMAKVIANQGIFFENQKKTLTAELMRQTPRPAQGADTTAPQDYAKLIAEAQANGDFTASAYYTRLQEESRLQGDNNN